MGEEIRVGLVGLGYIGRIHAQAYAHLPLLFGEEAVNAKLHCILRTHSGDEPRLIAALGHPLETSSLSTFNDQEPNLVDICSPNAFHLQQIKDVLPTKPHLYCEKPIGLNLAEAREIAALSAAAQVLTHTAFVYRYYPAVRALKALLAAGALGEIYNFRMHYFHNSYMDPARPISWRLKRAIAGGGALADLGIHLIDMLLYVLGEVQWVRCTTDTFIRQRPIKSGSLEMEIVDVDDWALCMVGLACGSRGVLEVTRLSGGAGNSLRFEIFGSLGSASFDLGQPEHACYYDQKRHQMIIGEHTLPPLKDERPLASILPPHKMSMGHFRDAHAASIYDFLLDIQEGKESSANFHQAVKAQEVLEAAYRSAETDGGKVQLPLP